MEIEIMPFYPICIITRAQESKDKDVFEILERIFLHYA